MSGKYPLFSKNEGFIEFLKRLNTFSKWKLHASKRARAVTLLEGGLNSSADHGFVWLFTLWMGYSLQVNPVVKSLVYLFNLISIWANAPASYLCYKSCWIFIPFSHGFLFLKIIRQSEKLKNEVCYRFHLSRTWLNWKYLALLKVEILPFVVFIIGCDKNF